MRAFLSTNGGQLREASTHCDLWPVSEVLRSQSHAEREACKILNSSEREDDGDIAYSFWNWGTGRGPALVHEGPWRALAESLEAFLQMEVR